MKPLLFSVFSIALLFSACSEEEIFIPKPRIYPKVEYPKRNMVKLDQSYCNFTFEYPDYMVYEQDTKFVNQNTKHPCWFNLRLPSLNGDIHFTYTDISGDSLKYNIYEMYKDVYELADKHNIKAVGNQDNIISNPQDKVYGVLFNIDGYVASPFQFMVMDSVQHAVRASLYFKSHPDPDSMAPVIEFVKTDMVQILNSFKWNK